MAKALRKALRNGQDFLHTIHWKLEYDTADIQYCTMSCFIPGRMKCRNTAGRWLRPSGPKGIVRSKAQYYLSTVYSRNYKQRERHSFSSCAPSGEGNHLARNGTATISGPLQTQLDWRIQNVRILCCTVHNQPFLWQRCTIIRTAWRLLPARGATSS